jgi:pilus assembly protein Flp/PilA
MCNLNAKIRAFLRDEEGLTTVEYAVAGALISLAVITAFTNLGAAVGNVIQQLADVISGGAAGG